MNLMLSIEPQLANAPITYSNQLLFVGSCFSDHIGARMEEAKFRVMYNPTGIVFDPLSVAKHLTDWAQQQKYQIKDLQQGNELWFHWLFHSAFSSVDEKVTATQINEAIEVAGNFLQTTSHLFITLGTAFSYTLKSTGLSVANCHKAPRDWFDKRLLETEEMVMALQAGIAEVKKINPSIQVVLTVSPVKHIRDGIVENSRSKARLLEVVHRVAEREQNCTYFPVYEIVAEVLRDYRFYAPDMAHPNEQAIDFVFNFFKQTYFNSTTMQLFTEVMQLVTAKNHRPLHMNTQAYQNFLKGMFERTILLKTKLPYLDWSPETTYFGSTTTQS